MGPIYLFGQKGKRWDHILSDCDPRGTIILFLDYDGTLVPIRKKPSLAVLAPHVKQLLRRLSRRRHVSVALVTGRSLADIRKIANMNGLTTVANHGFQISHHSKNWTHPRAIAARPVLQKIHSNLKKELSSIPGLFIEDKQQTLTVHYRTVKPRYTSALKKAVQEAVAPFHHSVKVTAGKKVLEVRPRVAWDKGRGVKHVLKLLHGKPIPFILYIGDDATDEDAFKVLRGKALTIRVGRSRTTRAQYYVRNPKEVWNVLGDIERVTNIWDSEKSKEKLSL